MTSMGSGRSGAFAWLFQRVSGIALVVILLLHFVLVHYVGDGPVSYDKVAWRLASPYYKAWEMLFLVLGLYHAMNGIKLVIDDYVHQSGWRTILTGANWLLALALFLFGSITVLSFTFQAG